ncbi:MAG: VOC family protein [Gemmatimonadetes bacterium]|nr:VOC family protein [Gemmatimonadota bacterium]
MDGPRRAVAGLALDHVAIAARSFTDLLPLLERLSGVRATDPEQVESQGVEVCFVGDVELIRPLVPESGVSRFVERRGPGLHHIAYRVADLGEKMAELTAGGWEFTSPGPMEGAGGHRIAFLHPRSTGGVLVELVERARQDPD